jgi:phosphomannomutase
MLRGDEVGALLGDHLLRSGKQGVYAASIVSSSLLGKLAEAAGQEYAETLTGFKWIGRVPGLAFGYEEALGYCVDPVHVKDKDGVSALLLLCDIAARAKAEGRTLPDLLDDIAVRHGLHATDQLSARVADLSEIPAAMARLRENPPVTLGGLAVLAVDDLSLGSDLLPPTDGLRYRLADGARVIVRPSGTEPNTKCYLEVVVPVHHTAPDENTGSADAPRAAVDAARIAASGRLDALRNDIKAAAGI